MSGLIDILQYSAVTDIPTPASGRFNVASVGDELVAKDDSGNVLYFQHWRRYTQQTTNNTNTVPSGAYVSVAEGKVVLVKAKVVGRQSTLASALGVEMWVIARRASGGNVTLVGTVQGTAQEDNGGTPAATLVADTVNQRVNVQVTGITAETWDWEVDITGMVY